MPLVSYRPVSGQCPLCQGAFDHLQPANSPDLQECPKCGLPVTRLAQATAAPFRITKPVSNSQARQAGFTILRKTSDGSYEKG